MNSIFNGLVDFLKPFVLAAKFMSVKSFIFPYFIFISCRTYSDTPCITVDIGNLYLLFLKLSLSIFLLLLLLSRFSRV